jgi:hypothetical protein
LESYFQKGMQLFGADQHCLMNPQCRKVHPWLSYYEDDWLLKALTQQLLQDTSKKYKWEDWGEDSLIEAMDARADRSRKTVHTSLHHEGFALDFVVFLIRLSPQRSITPPPTQKKVSRFLFRLHVSHYTRQMSTTKPAKPTKPKPVQNNTPIESDADDEESEQAAESEEESDSSSDDTVPDSEVESSKDDEQVSNTPSVS